TAPPVDRGGSGPLAFRGLLDPGLLLAAVLRQRIPDAAPLRDDRLALDRLGLLARGGPGPRDPAGARAGEYGGEERAGALHGDLVGAGAGAGAHGDGGRLADVRRHHRRDRRDALERPAR